MNHKISLGGKKMNALEEMKKRREEEENRQNAKEQERKAQNKSSIKATEDTYEVGGVPFIKGSELSDEKMRSNIRYHLRHSFDKMSKGEINEFSEKVTKVIVTSGDDVELDGTILKIGCDTGSRLSRLDYFLYRYILLKNRDTIHGRRLLDYSIIDSYLEQIDRTIEEGITELTKEYGPGSISKPGWKVRKFASIYKKSLPIINQWGDEAKAIVNKYWDKAYGNAIVSTNAKIDAARKVDSAATSGLGLKIAKLNIRNTNKSFQTPVGTFFKVFFTVVATAGIVFLINKCVG
jgi:hypothetical protein